MAALVNALDKHTPIQIGENGHNEYGWSHDIREKVVQLSFQLTRTKNMNGLEEQLRNVLKNITSQTSIFVEAKKLELLVTLYKMVGQTRDIIDGKGEYALAFMMICVWYDFFPELAKYALLAFVVPEFDEASYKFKKEHPYGSWKDIKYFCEYCRTLGWSLDHPLIVYAASLIENQLRWDIIAYDEGRYSDMSLLCKWIARETSGKFGWIYSTLAIQHFKHYIITAKTPETFVRATNKAKMDYRKLISKLNKALGTTQIAQCGGTWSSINFNKVTSITFSKQKRAFLNKKNNGEQRSELKDRIVCAENFVDHIRKITTGEEEIKGKRIGMEHFTKQALDLYKRPHDSEHDILNSQWRDNASQTRVLDRMIPMVDVSESMMQDNAFNVAVALGCRVAEKSILGRRMITFTAHPEWCNFDNATNFIDMVRIIKQSPVGYNTDFYAALDLILDACIEKKLPADDVSGMILAIFSDMQMDACGSSGVSDVLYNSIKEKYLLAGMRAIGEPYTPPHILFWNLRSTHGFPVISTQKNVSMVSGFSPSLLNLFCEKGLEAFHSCTPWYMLMQSLNNNRYLRLEKKALEILS